MIKEISKKKQKLIDVINNNPLKVGETVSVINKAIPKLSSSRTLTASTDVVIVSLNPLMVAKNDRTVKSAICKISESDITSRNIFKIGANPFSDRKDTTRSINYGLDSIIFNLDLVKEKTEFGNKETKMNGFTVKETNWNPYVYNSDGEKEYYQRDFVWSLEDKQLLVESIYKGIQCAGS